MQEYLERFDHGPKFVGDPVEEKYRPGRVSLGPRRSLLMHSVGPLRRKHYDEHGGLAHPTFRPHLWLRLWARHARAANTNDSQID